VFHPLNHQTKIKVKLNDLIIVFNNLFEKVEFYESIKHLNVKIKQNQFVIYKTIHLFINKFIDKIIDKIY
jgi:hypothetical protein